MNTHSRDDNSRVTRLAVLLALLVFLGVAVAATRPATVRAEGGGALVAEPVLPATAAGARELFGASPAEVPGEVWGVGTKPSRDFQQVIAGSQDIIRYTDAGGWESLPEPVEAEGAPISGMEIPEAATAGRTTPAGGVAVAAQVGSDADGTHEKLQAFLVRDPGGSLRVVLPPEGFLGEGEELFQYTEPRQATSIQIAPVEESTAATGVFVAPHLLPGHLLTSILHYNGEEWTRNGSAWPR